MRWRRESAALISSRRSGRRCPRGAEQCPVRDLDNAKVRTIANLCDAATEQGHTNLHGYVVLKDAIEDVLKEAIGEVGVEERGSPAVVGVVVGVMMVMVAPSTYCVQFRIAQFTHFTHDFPPYPEMLPGYQQLQP
jgi:hypothetical protein